MQVYDPMNSSTMRARNVHSIQVCRRKELHLRPLSFCDIWQWIFLAISMCQQADPNCQWTALACTESGRTTTCRLQGATIAIPSRSGSHTKKYIKHNSTTTLLASGVQRCVEPFPSLSRRPACMCLYLANGYLRMTEDALSFVII